jgi:hypothetical protein
VTALVAFDDNQERQEWQIEEEVFMKESLAQAFDQESQAQDTEPLTPVPILEYTI